MNSLLRRRDGAPRPAVLRACLVALLALLPVAGAARAADGELGALLAPGAQPARVAYGANFAEGPAWSPSGHLLFIDIRGQAILRIDDEATGTTTVVQKPSGGASGLTFDAAGRLYASQGGTRRVVRFDYPAMMKTEVLAADFAGAPLNSPNDLTLDPHGGVYFTDPARRGGRPREQPVTGVYYVDLVNGEVRRVIDDLEYPNGIRVSDDGKDLYVADSRHRRVWRFDIVAPGHLGARSLFYQADPELDDAGPDGLALDARGNVYATYRGIVVIARDGHLVGRIPLDERPSNCTFGGSYGKSLYVTTRSGVYRIALQVAGQMPFPGTSPAGPAPSAR